MTTPGSAGRSPDLALRRELQRKALHASSVVAPLAYAAGLPSRGVLGGLLALLCVALAVEAARRTAAGRDRFLRLVGPLLRPAEAAGALAGATWLLAAYAGLVAAASPALAITGMWAIGAGDAAAAVVGRLVGRVRLPGGKSLEGAAAMAAVTAAGGWGLAGLDPMPAIVLALAASTAEALPFPGSDNLRVALVVWVVGPVLNYL